MIYKMPSNYYELAASQLLYVFSCLTRQIVILVIIPMFALPCCNTPNRQPIRIKNHPPIQAAGLFHEGEPMGSPFIAKCMSMHREEKLFNRASLHLGKQRLKK